MTRKSDFSGEAIGFLIAATIAGIWFIVALVIELIKASFGDENVDA